MEIKIDGYMNYLDAAQALGCSLSTLHRWIKDGKLTKKKVSGLAFVLADDVEKLAREIGR